MEDREVEEDREDREDQEEEFTVWHGLLLAESAAIMIGLVSPLTPSKTGSDRGIAHYFFAEPSYLQEVFVSFVSVNLLLVILGVVVAIWLKLKG
jgi:uncharacterized membrane protein